MNWRTDLMNEKKNPAPLLPLGALAAGFGMATLAMAQTAAPAPSAAASAPEGDLPAVLVRGRAEPQGKDGVRAATTGVAKGNQALRDVPQSVTVVTERLLDDRNLDTMKDALKNTAGISFLAAEGGEEDIRLRGFSLQGTGDIFIDGLRDPAFYDRDSFSWDRLEVLRGSASMLFGRGSTGGAVNQVTKQPMLLPQREVAVTAGSGGYLRGTADVNVKTGERNALRVNAMLTTAENDGIPTDKQGLAVAYRHGIGNRDEFIASFYHLDNDNGLHYGLPWLAPGVAGGNWLWPTDPKNYYGMASDYVRSGTTQGTVGHIHRFGGGAELKTVVRAADYKRDQRSSAVRFAAADLQPDGLPVTVDTFGPGTVLNRSGATGTGVQLKVMNMDTLQLQSDYSGRHGWFGLEHAVQAGVDAADESFDGFGLSPDSPVLTKPRTTVGAPDDGAEVDEAARLLVLNRTFEARALGAYLQDLMQIAPAWKLLGGLRWDRFEGTYNNLSAPANPNNNCTLQPATVVGRSDSLWSRRFGVLYQPTQRQSYHLSYGTSFNTSGDTYQYDAGSANVAPESSRNVELGARLDAADGRFTTRLALFHTTKYNERNRDATSVDACNYVLSGKRHAAGFEVDLAGRLTPRWEVYASYAFIPSARVDSSSGAQGTETQGSRPGLTPRHSGTVWTTYRVGSSWRFGAGLNARSGDRPAGLAPDSAIWAPRFITGDLMAEYTLENLVIKANLVNVADKHYADVLYRGHYIPGKPRTLQVTATMLF
jgi:catecholate siderophore receptor